MARWTTLLLFFALTGCSKEVIVKATKVAGTLVIEVSEDALIGTQSPCLTSVAVREIPSARLVWSASVYNDSLCQKRRDFRYGDRFEAFQTGDPEPLKSGTLYHISVSSTGGGHGTTRIRF